MGRAQRIFTKQTQLSTNTQIKKQHMIGPQKALLLSSSPYPYPSETSSLISCYPRSVFVQFLTLYKSNHTVYNLLCLAFSLFLMFVIHSCSCLSIPFCSSILEPKHTVLIIISLQYIFTFDNNKATVISTVLFFFRIALVLP